ncbi:DUF3175 domain-containing protein [Nitrospira sp. KM1]|uniref:DUF3175 domain-containing protein n=1 Tax=Nitrospira sp. KM1 TaxID=1936990 RepID=UPI002107B063|nr:DUF3175 domain-containing protein [Nitrospira sp. KM1]
MRKRVHGSSKHISKPRKTRKWSAGVMKRSDALDLEQGVFTKKSPKEIAASLKRSALRSHRRKGTPFQSAMSMLNFHINRGGSGLPASQKHRLERAKEELRNLFGRNDKPADKRRTPERR